MASLWLHVEEVPFDGGLVEIGREEARHAFGARRLGAGDAVTLFDGRGALGHAVLTGERARDGSMLARVESRESAPPLVPEVAIAFAVPKGDRLSTLLDLCTQAGASRLVPIECARSVVDAEKLDRGARWTRILFEATKVAKRAWTPELAPGGRLLEMARAELARGAAIAVAHTASARPLAAWAATIDATRPRTVFIGPEGGFDDGELEAMRELGAECVSLGPCVMRIEAAAMAAAVLLRG
jgi:16S rRNA (uracil1498-N3)-methyltransferase